MSQQHNNSEKPTEPDNAESKTLSESSKSKKNVSNEHHHHSHKHRSYDFSVNTDDVPQAKYRKEKKKKKKKSKKFVFFVTLGTVVISLLLIVAITLIILLLNGQKSLVGENKNTSAQIQAPANVEVDDDYIIYNGEKYKYNDKVTTILFAGIDKTSDQHIEGVLGTAGQADALFTMALNTETGKYKLMAISRDTMVDVNICDSNGNFKGTEKMQICLSHGYGDGKDTSTENLKRSVSRLFFGIPVNSYMIIDLDAISILNDAVGGVTVNVVEDLSHRDSALVKGKTVTLKGEQAVTYVRYRDIYKDENQNNLRMERQKSYLNSFIHQTIDLTKKDISTPITLYNQIADYTKTDIDASKITYLASVFLQIGFSADEDLIKIPGETVLGEKYAEYYVDTNEFFKIVLDTYYTKVEE